MSYYYGQPINGHPNPPPGHPYPPQLPYSPYPVTPQAPVAHAPVDPQAYFAQYGTNVPTQAMPNYGHPQQQYAGFNQNPVVPAIQPSDPTKRPLPSPAGRPRPASVVLPPSNMMSPAIPGGVHPGVSYMHNMSGSISPSGYAPMPPVTPGARPNSVHGLPAWNAYMAQTQMAPVSPIIPNNMAQMASPVQTMQSMQPRGSLPTPGAVNQDPNKRALPPPPPGSASSVTSRPLPASASLPPTIPNAMLPSPLTPSGTQSLPSIPATSILPPISTTVPVSSSTGSSSPTKRSLPTAPGGGGIVPGAGMSNALQKRSTLPAGGEMPKPSPSPSLPSVPESSRTTRTPEPPSRTSPSPQPPTRSSTTPVPANPSPPPTSAPSSYASARSVFSNGTSASPPPTGRPMSSSSATSDVAGDDKIPLWKRMAMARGDMRPQSVFGHRARSSADEGNYVGPSTSTSNAASVIQRGVSPSSGTNAAVASTSMVQRHTSPIPAAPRNTSPIPPAPRNTSPIPPAPRNVSPAPPTQRNQSPIPPAPSPVSQRPPLPIPPGSTTSVAPPKKIDLSMHFRSQSVPVKDHSLPQPPKSPDSHVRFSKAPQVVTATSPPRAVATSQSRATAVSPPRASAMKSGTKTPVQMSRSRSEIVSTSPPRVQVPPATRSSPLPPSPTRPSPTRQSTAPPSSFSRHEETPKVSMALRFAAGDIGKHANNNRDWAKWALSSTKEVIEHPEPIEGKGRDSARRRSASVGQIDEDESEQRDRRGSFGAGSASANEGISISNSAYANSRKGGARPMPARPTSQASSRPRVDSGEYPQYRPSYSDSDSDDDASTSNPTITFSSPTPQINVTQMAPMINVEAPSESSNVGRSRSGSNPPPSVPIINIGGEDDMPAISITVDEPSRDAVVAVPVFSFSGPEEEEDSGKKKKKKHKREKSVKEEEDERERKRREMKGRPLPPKIKKNSARCGKCDKSILGRIVSAMNARWHPECFKCTACDMLLEHVSSYEHDDRPYCHLDYHELFAPRCFHCKTPIMEEHFITLDDDVLGKRTYHEQHFFCAECGDPFLAPKQERKTRMLPNGTLEVVDQEDEVGFTVYKGHPYCETCHVRLRMPKCKRCKKSIRPGDQAIEALGGKWCWGCFTCDRCNKPFDDPQFYEHQKKPFCQPCYSIILVNQLG